MEPKWCAHTTTNTAKTRYITEIIKLTIQWSSTTLLQSVCVSTLVHTFCNFHFYKFVKKASNPQNCITEHFHILINSHLVILFFKTISALDHRKSF